MQLSNEDRAILAHIVIDPEAWVTHAIATAGEKTVTAKIERWKPIYLAEKVKPDYKNRAERDKIEKDLQAPTPEQVETMKKNAMIKAKIREMAIDALIAEGKL